MERTVTPDETAWEEYCSLKCSACESPKRKGMSFCRVCYWLLPATLRNDLWKRFGAGYEEAYQAAKDWLLRASHDSD